MTIDMEKLIQHAPLISFDDYIKYLRKKQGIHEEEQPKIILDEIMAIQPDDKAARQRLELVEVILVLFSMIFLLGNSTRIRKQNIVTIRMQNATPKMDIKSRKEEKMNFGKAIFGNFNREFELDLLNVTVTEGRPM